MEEIRTESGLIAAKNTRERFLSRIFKMLREFFAIVFWFYSIFKIFIYDFDVYLFNNFIPECYWIIKYKFPIILSIVVIFVLLTKNKKSITSIMYIVFYPFIVVFWKIPFFIFKQKSWVFAFVVINSVISFFRSIKYKFILSAVFIISFFSLFIVNNKIILSIACLFLLSIILIIYVRNFIMIFKPSSIFQVYIKIFSKIREKGTSQFALDDEIKALSMQDYSEKQLEKWSTSLQTSVLFNRICLFTAKKLKDYQNSGFGAVSSVITILLFLLLTVISFAGINYGLYKIDHGMFALSSDSNFFLFIYHSFNNIFSNSIVEIRPILTLSRLSVMMQFLFTFLIVAILLTLVFSYKNQKNSKELNEAITGIENEAMLMESFIAAEYKFSNIDDAIMELDKLKTALIKFILNITNSLK